MNQPVLLSNLGVFGITLISVLLSPVALADALPQRLTAADFLPHSETEAKLGQLLFYDKILSGNKNISCGTCHHHEFFGSDGLSLGIGEGGVGLGPERTGGDGASRIKRRIPRNAPALWNLGAKEIKVLFHDGRLTRSDLYGNGFNSPAEERLPGGLSGLLAAQALFPLTARFEMAGDPEENSVARAAFDRIDHVWPIITKRIQANREYVEAFINAFEHINAAGDIQIVDVANALGAFIALEWQSYDSPFDGYLAGDPDALSPAQKRGMDLFYGAAGCSTCHSGSLLSDQKFHALALPPYGPGRTRLFDPLPRDMGHLNESDDLVDRYRFRTPSLRNVELTGPYGHNGAYRDLSRMIKHHLNPLDALSQWSMSDASMPDVPWLVASDLLIQQDVREMLRYKRKVDIETRTLDEANIADLVEFLHALTGDSVRKTPFGRPDAVPSGLIVD